MNDFFRYFMFKETAIYTLAGSKPLTSMPLFYERLPEGGMNEKNQIDKEKKGGIITAIERLWDEWEKMQHRFPLKKNFLLVKRAWSLSSWKDLFPECEAVYEVFLVNVFKTALVIQKNDNLFRQKVGYDFDPLELVFERMTNRNFGI